MSLQQSKYTDLHLVLGLQFHLPTNLLGSHQTDLTVWQNSTLQLL